MSREALCLPAPGAPFHLCQDDGVHGRGRRLALSDDIAPLQSTGSDVAVVKGLCPAALLEDTLRRVRERERFCRRCSVPAIGRAAEFEDSTRCPPEATLLSALRDVDAQAGVDRGSGREPTRRPKPALNGAAGDLRVVEGTLGRGKYCLHGIEHRAAGRAPFVALSLRTRDIRGLHEVVRSCVAPEPWLGTSRFPLPGYTARRASGRSSGHTNRSTGTAEPLLLKRPSRPRDRSPSVPGMHSARRPRRQAPRRRRRRNG